jgi:peptidoglycan/LPS O-acetylase OafA/YrhL
LTSNEESLLNLATFKTFIAGIFIYILSWAVRRLWSFGDAYNDLLTALGVLLITVYPSHLILQVSGERVVSALRRLSNQSYLMYLLHGFLIIFVAKPLLDRAGLLPLNSLVSVVCAVLYCALMFLLASLIAKPLNYLSSVLSRAILKKDIPGLVATRRQS